jgi:hypothetical protein
VRVVRQRALRRVRYQALLALLDKATPLEQLEIVELATLAAQMSNRDRRWLIETAARLPKEDEGREVNRPLTDAPARER